MLQQTTVNAVVPKFNQFVGLWPSIKKLSKINESTILKFWSGLGYYARAKNLLKSIKIISIKFNNIIPSNYNDLINLPGIGDYTAKAILGIAFNKQFMPIDANIERIISRIYGLSDSLKEEKENLHKRSKKFISKNNSSKFIQSLMDYGSAICLPRNPKCEICVIQKYCMSYKQDIVHLVPKKNENKINRITKYTRAYIFLNHQQEILIRKRSSRGMLPSMLEIPNDKWVIRKKNLTYDKNAIKLKNKIKSKGSLKYSFSHFDLEAEVFFLKIDKKMFLNQRWIKKNNIKKSGLPTVMKKIVEFAF